MILSTLAYSLCPILVFHINGCDKLGWDINDTLFDRFTTQAALHSFCHCTANALEILCHGRFKIAAIGYVMELRIPSCDKAKK